MINRINLFLLITVLLVPLIAYAKEEQNDTVIFQQYKQDIVKPYNYSYNGSFMNFMMFPYPYGRYRPGFAYIGHNRLYDFEQENRYLLRDRPKDTLVNPDTYPVKLQENL